MTAHHVEEKNTTENENGLKWLLPILLLILLAALCWYFFGKKTDHAEVMPAHTEEAAHTAKTETDSTGMSSAKGTLDSMQNFVYEMGKMVTIDLPNNAGKMEVGEYSTENRLYKFLSDKSATLDTVKGNWFEFTNVRFKSGGTQIDSSSLLQLKNMVMFCKAFPTAQFKVGGYTDNSGDSAKNVILSEKRANAVLVEIIKQGAAAASFTGAKGYGPAHPIGDNATAEGKAMNRRVAVNVKAK
jgi:OmpA-OmpF porin, OOP family